MFNIRNLIWIREADIRHLVAYGLVRICLELAPKYLIY